jgi:hypothetical protein
MILPSSHRGQGDSYGERLIIIGHAASSSHRDAEHEVGHNRPLKYSGWVTPSTVLGFRNDGHDRGPVCRLDYDDADDLPGRAG